MYYNATLAQLWPRGVHTLWQAHAAGTAMGVGTDIVERWKFEENSSSHSLYILFVFITSKRAELGIRKNKTCITYTTCLARILKHTPVER